MDGHLGRQLLLVFILILVNAFFAAAEIAVLSLNANKVHKEADEGSRQAKKLLKLVEEPTPFLSTIQIAITLAGFLASAFAADTFSDQLTSWLINTQGWAVSEKLLNTVSLIVITLILSYFTLVLGELVPKRIAMAKSEAVTRFTADVVLAVGVVFKPLVALLSASTNLVLKIFRVDPDAEENQVSEEEIRMMVDIGGETGTIEEEEAELIENVFDFNDITAADVMTHRTDMQVIWLEDKKAQILALIEESGLSRFPVCGDDIDDVRGILRTREYLIERYKENPRPLAELMAPVYFVPESIPARNLFRDMQKRKVHLAIVVDEYGGTSGLVTMEDLLEELVGEIYDEFDQPEETDIIPLEDNLWRISGSCDIDDVWQALEMEAPEDLDVETLGGLVYTMLSEIPADGDTPVVDACGLHIEVMEMADRRVEWALVSKLPEPHDDDYDDDDEDDDD